MNEPITLCIHIESCILDENSNGIVVRGDSVDALKLLADSGYALLLYTDLNDAQFWSVQGILTNAHQFDKYRMTNGGRPIAGDVFIDGRNSIIGFPGWQLVLETLGLVDEQGNILKPPPA